MPGKVKVKIVAGRNLPVMDRSSDTTDAYVEVKLGNTTFKTDVCRKSLNPQWNSEWYRFEMDDAELQDEPLQIRLMDHDTYSANDAIGKVYLDLNPLLLPPAGSTAKAALADATNSLSGEALLVVPGNTMSGWFPVYDTMHGIRGEVNVIVKVELFSDFNKFRQSSCGVQFFNSSTIPAGYQATVVHGMVEELVVSDDPEYKWIDKIRTPRASNEARQTLFFKLSGEVQRRIGLKVLDFGGNAVIGYLQCFDLEAECGIVVRGLGTAVTLVRVQEPSHPLPCHYAEETVPEDAATPGVVTLKSSQSPIKFNHNHMPGIHRRSSDSDLSITPKGSTRKRNSLTSSGDRSSNAGGYRNLQPLSNKLAMKKEPLEVMEFPFLTMMKFPPGFVVHIAGTVTSRSVKLLERVANQEEPESRDAWWKELRLEVRSHMKAMSCNAVIGYSENTTICDDVCVLSASGTAAVVNVKPVLVPPVSDTPEPPVVTKPPVTAPPISAPPTNTSMTTSLDRTDFERTSSFSQSTPLKPDGGGNKARHHSDSLEQPDSSTNGCALCHLPFNPASVPLPMSTIRCAVCSKRKVPDLLLATVEPLEGLPVIGRTCLIHVCVTRPKQHARGELNACVVSDSLPFIEYDIYKQLVNKLKVNGMNAVFGLKTQICLGEKLIAAVTSGTAVYLEPLPPPSMPSITAGESCAADSKLATVLRGLQDTVRKNREFYQVKTAGTSQESGDTAADGAGSDTEDSDDDLPDMDLHAGNKEACVFMVDDEQDMEAVSQLIDPHPPEGFFVTATETLPGLDELEVVRNLQMFTQIWRSRLPATQPTSSMHKHFHRLLQGIYYKLRRMTPCAVGNIKFRLALPEPDEMQISIVGMAVGLGEMIKNVKSVRRRAGTLGASSKPESLNTSKKSDDGDMIFSLEEDQESNSAQSTKAARPKSPRPTRQSTHLPPRERYGVDLTPLSYVPGGHIERYLGNLNFFFIRETSCIREGGGMSGFVHSFVAEVLAIIRAHVTALGGNAMVAFFLNECIILNNPHKNHGQCLINVGGDAVSVSYVD
ncbi:C2 domain-containing protein 5 isoform X4 [Macrosteles quadrilineatus]|uniref:C2 domain-containing protein 5 isoform X4 n=1 Tax=Macrosteles quadrilineatus TaxID=74068 RepID=UPI0023E224BD|nr:C2 domain-containing protein 5 isoform X4 [Macrosteles quadrilineatus]